MGNKFQFLLEYDLYLNNINILSEKEDNIMYKKILSQSKNDHLVILEGLITTHPINKSIKVIKKRFPYLKSHIENDGEIYIEGEFTEIGNYLPIFTNLGYFISLLTIDGQNWIKEYDKDTKPIALYLEAKNDIKIDNIPNILYHTSPTKHKNKISKIGFIPKTGNKLSNHPDRIYLTDNFDIAFRFGINIKKETKGGFCVYEINGKCVDNIYIDINLKDSGYYTKQNISPNCFKLIKEIK